MSAQLSKMVKYGYPMGIDSTKLITPLPHELDKIHLTLTRPKFIIVGTKDSIYNWMENYGNRVCEFNPRTQCTKKITFELRHDDDSVFKRLFSTGTRVMKLEIVALTPTLEHVNPSTVVPSGIRLQEVLMELKKKKNLNCDYEL